MLSEVASYLERINTLRGQVWKIPNGLDAEGLNWRPLDGDTNSLFVLATHSLGAEHGWIGEILGNGPRTRVRPLEFQAHGESMDELRGQLETTGRESERVLSSLSENDLKETRQHKEHGTISGRWIILHVIEHYAEHLGQMRLTRQLWENRGVSARPHAGT